MSTDSVQALQLCVLQRRTATEVNALVIDSWAWHQFEECTLIVNSMKFIGKNAS